MILIVLPLFFSYIIETHLEKDAEEESAFLKVNMLNWEHTGRWLFIFIFAVVYSLFWWGFLGALILIKNLFFGSHKISAPFYCVNSCSVILIYLVNLIIVKNRRENYKFMKFFSEKDRH